MSNGVSFEAYLSSKKIDSELFRKAEPAVWEEWRNEFEQMHPNSFTVQKLNLINAVRRKYLLQQPVPEVKPAPTPATPGAAPAPKPGRPVMRPRPKG